MIQLLDQEGDFSVRLQLHYSFEFDAQAYLRKAADEKARADDAVPVPKQLVFYDIKSHLAENCDIVKDPGNSVQVVASSGSACQVSGFRNSDWLKIKWPNALVLRGLTRSLKLLLTNHNDIPLANFEGTVADFPSDEGVRRLQLTSSEGNIAELVLKYSRLPFDEEEYHLEQEHQQAAQAKRGIRLHSMRFNPEKNKKAYLLVQHGEGLLRVNPLRLSEVKVPLQVNTIRFLEKNGEHSLLGSAEVRTQQLID